MPAAQVTNVQASGMLLSSLIKCGLAFFPYFHHRDEGMRRIQQHALTDTVESVNGQQQIHIE